MRIITEKRKGGGKMAENKWYIAIDLKSFYASVECVARGLDPLKTNLVVADMSRTEKTICLAVTPSLKKYGIPGRARLFEVIQKVREVQCTAKAESPLQTGPDASQGLSVCNRETTIQAHIQNSYELRRKNIRLTITI